MLSLLKLPVKVPSSYSPQWNFRNFWDEYLENVNNSTLKESEDFDSDDEKKTKSDPVSLFLFKTKNSKAIPLDDLKYIYKNDIFKYETEHKKLIKDLGILTIDNLESCNELLKKTPLDFSNRIREQINNINLNLNKVMDSKNEFEINPIREIFLSFFKVSKFNKIISKS